MHVKIQREAAKEALEKIQAVARAVKAAFFVLSADETTTNAVSFRIVGDYESLECEVESEIVETGSGFIPLARFTSLVEHTVADEISVKLLNGDQLRITGKNLSDKCPTKFLEHLPPAWAAPQLEIPIDVAPLRALIGRVKRAMEKEGGQLGFQVVKLSFRPGSATALAASNHGVAAARYQNDALLNNVDALIPRTMLESFERTLALMDGEIAFGVDSNRLTLSGSGVRYSCGTVASGPPNVAAMLSTDGTNAVELDSREFVRAIKLAATSLQDDATKRFLTLKFQRDALVISGAEDGSTDTQIEASYDTPCQGLVKAFKAEFLLDSIGKSERVKLHFNTTENQPVVVTHEGDEFSTRWVVAAGRLD